MVDALFVQRIDLECNVIQINKTDCLVWRLFETDVQVVDIERDQSPYFGFFRLYFGFHLGLPYEQNWGSGSDACADKSYFYT